MKTFEVSLFHRKPCINNTINENDKIIRNKYSLNNTKTVIGRSFCHVIVEEPVLLGCCAVWSGNFFPMFKEVYHLHLHVTCHFTASGINYSTTQCNNPKGLVPQYDNRFVMNKFFQLSVIYSGYCTKGPT
jgi:hypothetical protein